MLTHRKPDSTGRLFLLDFAAPKTLRVIEPAQGKVFIEWKACLKILINYSNIQTIKLNHYN